MSLKIFVNKNFIFVHMYTNGTALIHSVVQLYVVRLVASVWSSCLVGGRA